MVNTTESQKSESLVWPVLIGILLLFTAVILYARHINIKRQDAQVNVPVVAHYTNYAYGVNLRFPPDWRPVSGTTYDRYEGADGFFSLSAAGGPGSTLGEVVSNEVTHPLKPYGTNPTITNLIIDGQPARLIMPSADQDASMHGQAVIIATYPKPMKVGTQDYQFLVFWADRSHIQDMASTITFLNR